MLYCLPVYLIRILSQFWVSRHVTVAASFAPPSFPSPAKKLLSQRHSVCSLSLLSPRHPHNVSPRIPVHAVRPLAPSPLPYKTNSFSAGNYASRSRRSASLPQRSSLSASTPNYPALSGAHSPYHLMLRMVDIRWTWTTRRRRIACFASR